MTELPELLTARALSSRYRAGTLSPVEVTKGCLATAEAHNEQLRAFVSLEPEEALDAARAAEARWHTGRPLSPIDGVPATVKDVLAMRGAATLRGSLTCDPGDLAPDDAPAVALLRDAGAVLIGKTATPEFGWKGVTDSPLTGITRNPWDPSKTPGGSSGGAAVAAAMGMGALHFGTDGGGSIRIPASFTGVVGFKPTFGRVPAFPLSPFGTVSHIGPMTRSVDDCALMYAIIAWPDPRDAYSLPACGPELAGELDQGVKGLRFALSTTLGFGPPEPEVAKRLNEVAQALEHMGAHIEETALDLTQAEEVFRVHWFAGAGTVLRGIEDAKRRKMDQALVEVGEQGNALSLPDYLDAAKQREALTSRLNALHQRYDLLLTPSTPLTAFEAGLEVPLNGNWGQHWHQWTPFSYPFNLTGQPAISQPAGRSSDGLPIGVQIVGPRYADAIVLRAAKALEKAFPFEAPPTADGAGKAAKETATA